MQLGTMCGWGDLNPHTAKTAPDSKSGPYANSGTPAGMNAAREGRVELATNRYPPLPLGRRLPSQPPCLSLVPLPSKLHDYSSLDFGTVQYPRETFLTSPFAFNRLSRDLMSWEAKELRRATISLLLTGRSALPNRLMISVARDPFDTDSGISFLLSESNSSKCTSSRVRESSMRTIRRAISRS